MSRLLIIGSGPVALYYGSLFSNYGYLVDHTITTERRKNDITDRFSVVSELPEFKCIYNANLVTNLELGKYEYIIIACEAKHANSLCISLKQSDLPTIVLTSCWNTYHEDGNTSSSAIWGFPRILCESTKNCLKAISLETILIDAKDVYDSPQKVLTFRALFASVNVELQPVNLGYVYPYLFLLTTCMYTQMLNEQKVGLDISFIRTDRPVMDDCYTDAYILLSKKMEIPVDQAESQTGVQWNPDFLINTATFLLRESNSSLSVTGWIVNQLINHKRTKMQYFIKTLLEDSNTKDLNHLRLALLNALRQHVKIT